MSREIVSVKEFIGRQFKNVFFVDECYLKQYIVKDIYIFGAGEDGRYLYKFLKKNNIEVSGYLDNAVDVGKYRLLGKLKIEHPEVVVKRYNRFIVVASQKYDRHMVQQLRKMGCIPGTDFGVWISQPFGWRKKFEHDLRNPFDHAYIYTWIRRNITDFVTGWLRTRRILPFYQGYEQIDKLRNTYFNKRCFILCTGPSLNKEDIFKLSNEYTFGINSFFVITEKIGWKPTFYFTTNEPSLQEIFIDRKLRWNDTCKNKFMVTDNCKKYEKYGTLCLIPMLALNPWHYLSFSGSCLKHSTDALHGLYEYTCTTLMCIDLAMYMGFSEIYLLGADNDYLGEKMYVDEIDEDVYSQEKNRREFRWVIGYRDSILQMKANEICYEYLNQIAINQGTRIFNATRGGTLEVYPRVNLDDIL